MSAVCNNTSTCEGFLYRILNQENQEVGHLAGTFYFQNDDYFLSKAMTQAIEKANIVYVKAVPLESSLVKPNPSAIDYKVFEMAQIMEKCVTSLETQAPQGAQVLEGSEWLNAILSKLQENHVQDFYSYFPNLGKNPAPELVVTYLQGLAYRYGEESLEQELLFSRPAAQLNIQCIENASMVEKVHESLKNEEMPFVALDISHLWGKEGQEGVIDLLKQRGWTIERIGETVPNELFREAIEHFEGFPESDQYIEHVIFWNDRSVTLR